tara:strand:+ start:2235 stop:3119 length:885 start_codon:yes stop_codon:yes gene_type:complete
MKGIILAGGSGTRLYPLTLSVSKQLIPIYNKPMIYYPLSTLMLIGIRDILIITTPKDKKIFKNLLGNGNEIGCKISYAVQEKPNGLAEAFIIGEKFIGNDNVALILGDNIFYGTGFIKQARSLLKKHGASIFAYEVSDPERYGVVDIDENGMALSIEEKPTNPKSSYAIPGLYFYDSEVIEIAKKVKPSNRGEKEISSINSVYLSKNKLHVTIINRGTTWLDTGTFQSLSTASSFVKTIEKRQDRMISCIEEIAYRLKYINKEELIKICKKYKKGEYYDYLVKISEKKIKNYKD